MRSKITYEERLAKMEARALKAETAYWRHVYALPAKELIPMLDEQLLALERMKALVLAGLRQKFQGAYGVKVARTTADHMNRTLINPVRVFRDQYCAKVKPAKQAKRGIK